MSSGVGHRCSLNLELLWLWCRPAAIVPIQPLAWELPHAMGAAPKTHQKNFFGFADKYPGNNILWRDWKIIWELILINYKRLCSKSLAELLMHIFKNAYQDSNYCSQFIEHLLKHLLRLMQNTRPSSWL